MPRHLLITLLALLTSPGATLADPFPLDGPGDARVPAWHPYRQLIAFVRSSGRSSAGTSERLMFGLDVHHGQAKELHSRVQQGACRARICSWNDATGGKGSRELRRDGAQACGGQGHTGDKQLMRLKHKLVQVRKKQNNQRELATLFATPPWALSNPST